LKVSSGVTVSWDASAAVFKNPKMLLQITMENLQNWKWRLVQIFFEEQAKNYSKKLC
jgi:hypothetical protein